MTRKKAVKVLQKKKNTKAIQRFTQKQNLGGSVFTAKQYRLLNKMCHSAKALRNVGLYTIRQSFFDTGKMPSINEIDKAMKTDVNYMGVQSNSAQAIRRTLLSETKSFFEALKEWKKAPDKFTGRPKFPKYSYATEKRVIEIYQVPKVDENGFWTVPMSNAFRKKHGSINIRMPQNLRNQHVTYIEIVPKQNGRFFEVHYTYEVSVSQMKKQPTTSKNALSCDIGIDRLLSCATNQGDAFLIDGKKLKSMNQYFNKEIAKLQQKNMENGLSKKVVTHAIATLWEKRNRQIDGYITQTVGLLFKQVKQLNVDTIVIGMNEGWKQHVNLGKKTNQSFVQIPFAKLLAAIENKCLKEGIRFVKQEESYTSKASHTVHPSFRQDERKPP